MHTFLFSAALTGCLLAATARCAWSKERTPTAVEPTARTEALTWGPVTLEFVFTPASVTIDRDMTLDLTIAAPEGMDVVVPPLEDRFTGLTISGHFEDEPVTRDHSVTRRLHFRLTPQIADEYRLAPFAVTYTDTRSTAPISGWFPTKPILLASRPPFAGDPGTTLAGEPRPLHIRPPFRTVAGYVAMALLGLGILFALWKFTRRVREEIALRRLSPRERALHELRNLLAKGLIERGHIKDFYVELTMIVRRYIERRHGVRAPEQTTEEFLAAISQDARFPPEVLSRLRAFLQAADRVKFAAHQPGSEAIRDATATAEAYITSDAEAPAAAEKAGRG